METNEHPEYPDAIIVETPVSESSADTEIEATSHSPDFFETVGRIAINTNEMIESLRRALQDFSKTVLTPMLETVANLARAIANFEIPTLSDEEAEELLESNRIWGQYGWTEIPSMPMGLFNTPPEDIQAANKAAMQYCTTSEMNCLFDELRKRKLHKKDLESAIFCYQNKQYKACALLLCGLIESKLIRLSSEDNRPVGERAVKRLKAEYDDSGEKYLAEALYVYNLLAYLETLFAKANGFKNEPETLNRNYIGHGMNHRPVRKRDCIQLFLALYNLTLFLDLWS